MIWGETPYTLPGGRHANLEEKSDSPDIQTSVKLLVNKRDTIRQQRVLPELGGTLRCSQNSRWRGGGSELIEPIRLRSAHMVSMCLRLFAPRASLHCICACMRETWPRTNGPQP